MPTRLNVNSLDLDDSDYLSNLNKINNSLFKQIGGKVSRKKSKKGSKLVSKKKSKKGSKLLARKKSKMSKKPSKMSKKPSKMSKKPSKISKKSKKSRKVKRELPLKLQAFQKIVKYLATELGGHTPMIIKLAKIIRDSVIESDPKASVDDITKKTMEEFSNNKSKYTVVYQKLKKN